MKRFTKICLAAAAVLSALGIACVITGLICGASFSDVTSLNVGWNRSLFGSDSSDEEAEQYVEEPAPEELPPEESAPEYSGEYGYENSFENIEKLDLDIGVADMIIQQGDSDSFRVYGDNLNDRFEFKESGGTLKIKSTEDHNWWKARRETPQITLEVPAGSVFKEADIDVGVGTLEANDFLCEKLELDCGVSEALINGRITGDCKITGGVGSVTMNLDNAEEEFNYKVECGIGSVDVGGNSYSGLGSSKKIDNGADWMMDIECGVGSVEINYN